MPIGSLPAQAPRADPPSIRRDHQDAAVRSGPKCSSDAASPALADRALNRPGYCWCSCSVMSHQNLPLNFERIVRFAGSLHTGRRRRSGTMCRRSAASQPIDSTRGRIAPPADGHDAQVGQRRFGYPVEDLCRRPGCGSSARDAARRHLELHPPGIEAIMLVGTAGR